MAPPGLLKSPRWLVHPDICSKRPSRGSEIGSEALLAQMEPAVAISRSGERVRTVEGSGPESSTRGFPLHGIDHWDGSACAGGPSAFILAPSRPRCRPITSDGAFGAKTGSILLTVNMLCKDVYTSNRDYVCTTGMCSPRVSSLSTPFRRSRIQ